MNRINLYLFKNLLLAFLFSTLAVTSVIWVTQALRLIDMVINAGAPVSVFISMMLLTVPTFLGIIMPVALAGAVLFTYNKLTTDSELVVMRAIGLGPWALAKPAIVLAGLVVGGVYFLNVYGGPAANSELVRLQYAVRNDYASVLIREGAFNDVVDGLTVFLRARADTGELEGLLVHDRRTEDKEVTVIADRGIMADAAGGIRLVMEDGLRQELEPSTGRFSELHFDRYVVEFRLFEQDGRPRFADPRERTMGELLNPPPEVRQSPSLMRQFLAEVHMRLSSPLLALSFAFIGLAALLSGEFDRRGQSRRLGVACFLVLVLQGLSLGMTGLANKNTLFIPAMYLLYMVPIAPAAWLLSRK